MDENSEADKPKPQPYADPQVRLYINHVGDLVNRRPGTVRLWVKQELLPEHLMPVRDERNWRYWTPEQAEGIKEWIISSNRKPGSGLPHYDPTDAAVNRAIGLMRKKRRPRLDKPPEG
jgi:hypothetical protein